MRTRLPRLVKIGPWHHHLDRFWFWFDGRLKFHIFLHMPRNGECRAVCRLHGSAPLHVSSQRDVVGTEAGVALVNVGV